MFQILNVVEQGTETFHVVIADRRDPALTVTVDVVGDIGTISQKLVTFLGSGDAVRELCFTARGTNRRLLWSKGCQALVDVRKIHVNHLHNSVNAYIRETIGRKMNSLAESKAAQEKIAAAVGFIDG